MYATEEEFIKFYLKKGIELGDIDGGDMPNPPSLSYLSSERINAALKAAASEINQIIGKVFLLPLPMGKKVEYLKYANEAIACKILETHGESEKTRDDYNDVLNRLREMAESGVLIADDGSRLPLKGKNEAIANMNSGMMIGNRIGVNWRVTNDPRLL